MSWLQLTPPDSPVISSIASASIPRSAFLTMTGSDVARKPPPVKACLFDMDGLLIDSEDLYTLVTNEVLAKYGRPELPWNIKAQMQGRPGPESAKIFHQWSQLPISNEEFYEMQKPIQEKYFPRAQILPGALELLEDLNKTHPRIHIALATSSHLRNYELKTNHLQHLVEQFPPDSRVLGDDARIAPGRGKPAPDIYLLALKTINDRLVKEGQAAIKPEECLVFEDSVPGVESGRRAGMQVIWCPHPGLLQEYKGREKEVLAGLTGQHIDDDSNESDRGEKVRQGAQVTTKTLPGRIDDGWGTQVENLENFPYALYGISVSQ